MNTLHIKLDRPLNGASIVDAADRAAIQRLSDSAQKETARHEATDNLLVAIGAALDKIQQQHQTSKQQLATAATRIATIITKQLVQRHDGLHIERLESLIEEALDQPELPVRIQLNPTDLARVEELIKNQTSGKNQIEFCGDEKIATGECRCEFQGHVLTSDLSTQIESIEDRLLEAVNE